MKRYKLILIFLVFYISLSAQPPKNDPESPSFLFNQFQKFSYENADSSFYYIRKLASNKRKGDLLTDLLHNQFAQKIMQFSPTDNQGPDILEKKLARTIALDVLAKIMSDTTRQLLQSAHPLFLLAEVHNNRDDPKALKNLVEEFIKTEIEGKDIYQHRAGRYGLMISQIIEKQPALKPLQKRLMALTRNDLEKNQILPKDATNRSLSGKRAWYRYLYAYVNFSEAQREDDLNKKKEYLKTAYEFSPDLIDNGNKPGFYYDMHFLSEEQNASFQDEYLEFLISDSTDSKLVLSTLLQMALINPELKQQLQDFYGKSSPAKNFDSYWSEAINEQAKPAFPIMLQATDKQAFSSNSLLGRWILVDFWGTWCGPCRQEHPDMQRFYDTTVKNNPDSLTLMTIACFDQQEKVAAYMKEKNFSFPVAISDNQIEKTYAVQGYPTKLLITPAGKYVTVPFGVDWIVFVKKYSGLK
ncbi:TlpA family protein disulfide reductase [Dyadobacter psychrotolerans]|uniref:Redoxin domain-containing protein n=1 Tax=Dyadobacter psychrotolerans TaxID=2541721 RepID=A0A4R5DVY6_9BACT|nr:TlpA family protein disulfide reductase [Dyadobacter psychrotolerans]TDE15193.1 redoxin domain-containing protein [Dyadobacter psychrotolerans]